MYISMYVNSQTTADNNINIAFTRLGDVARRIMTVASLGRCSTVFVWIIFILNFSEFPRVEKQRE